MGWTDGGFSEICAMNNVPNLGKDPTPLMSQLNRATEAEGSLNKRADFGFAGFPQNPDARSVTGNTL